MSQYLCYAKNMVFSRKNIAGISKVISRLFDPPVILSILTLAGILKSGIISRGIEMFIFLCILFIAPPFVFFLWLLKTRRIHDIDVSKRKERITPLVGILFFLFLDCVIVFFLQNFFLVEMFMIYTIWIVGFLIITLFWKISGHTGVATLAVGMLIQWFGWYASIGFLTVPVIAWARVVGRNHTRLQVVGGIVYSLCILLIFSL
ncbi:MAG: hypothetical protein N3A54_04725 [Patescibacteria group bacterium]|nr:hypothetical protein [Patescibacteria group bacterium]